MKVFNQIQGLFALLLVAPMSWSQTVTPETGTPVELSNRDVNRVVCTNGNINDVYFSQEKGIVVENNGASAFIKFVIKNDGHQDTFVNVRSEFYITCDNDVYTLMVTPKDNISGQTIRLSGGDKERMEENVSLLGPLAEEDRAIYLTKAVLTEDIPDSFQIIEPKLLNEEWRFDVIKNTEVTRKRRVRVDGFGMKLTEFWLKAKQDMYLDERKFLDEHFGTDIFAITVDPIAIRQGQVARILVVEKEISQ